MNCTLQELVQGITTYNSSEGGYAQWKGLDWLWARLPLPARIVATFRIAPQWWKVHYVKEVLKKEAIPFLERLENGVWRYSEEEGLRVVFMFAQSLKEDFPEKFASLLKSSFPSFGGERAKAQATDASKTQGGWYRDETLAQYRSRMKLVPRSKTPPRPRKEEPVSHVEKPRPKTTERLLRLVRDAETLKNEAVIVSGQVEQGYAKAFPLRYESPTIIEAIECMKSEIWTLISSIDVFYTRLPDPQTLGEDVSDEALLDLVIEGEQVWKKLDLLVKGIQKDESDHQRTIEEVRARIQKKLQMLSRTVDQIPLLSSASTFRTHESRILRMAREKIKRFRTSLSKGPGPEMSFDCLEHEVTVLIELARDFYREGTEVETIRQQLIRMEHQIQSMLDDTMHVSRTAALQALLTEVSGLSKTLEASPDRKNHFERITTAVAALHTPPS